jgi:hypothetical protein
LLATQQMLDEMRNIVAVLVGKALEGDTNAASVVLSKVMPSIKAQAEKVNFEFDATAPISDQLVLVHRSHAVLDHTFGGFIGLHCSAPN